MNFLERFLVKNLHISLFFLTYASKMCKISTKKAPARVRRCFQNYYVCYLLDHDEGGDEGVIRCSLLGVVVVLKGILGFEEVLVVGGVITEGDRLICHL